MFDKLIESDSQGADFKNRSRYFMVSTVVVGILFVTAVVFSLYAADIGLGNDEFEISMMLAPVSPETPETPKPVQPRSQPDRTRSDVPSRNENIQRLDENPKIPDAISVTPSLLKPRPLGRFDIKQGLESDGLPMHGTAERGTGGPVGTSSADIESTVAYLEKVPDPPPLIKLPPPVKKIVSEGVINGKAKYLPPPPYPAPARMVNAQGAVSVQVMIDETGEVISSRAVSGHPLLRGAAEKAAWNAKFSPTYLSRIPVKVTGVIVYKFTKN